MAGIRSVLSNNPKIGWGVAGVFFLVAAALLVIQMRGSGPADSIERRSEEVTLRCTETGEEWTMTRGQFERNLLLYEGELSEDGMLPSPPADGRLTAILVDRSDWRETVERINAMKAEYGGRRRGGTDN
ncbi:MAG: hypothetical protein ACF8Q5_01000 [Phycisphaerales bacterium JB040]